MKSFYVYIMASGKNGTLYIGVTNNLIRRVREHKSFEKRGFTQKYYVDKLVYFQETNDISVAIAAETSMKAWKRQWKIRIIEESNPDWKDLYYEYNMNGFQPSLE